MPTDTPSLQFSHDVSYADADVETTFAEHVERGQLLCQQDRLPLGQDQHSDAEANGASSSRKKRKSRKRLEPRLGRRVWGRTREGDVVPDPKCLEARLLSADSSRPQLLRVAVNCRDRREVIPSRVARAAHEKTLWV